MINSMNSDYSCWWEYSSSMQGSTSHTAALSSVTSQRSLNAFLQTTDGDTVEISIDARAKAEQYNDIGLENQVAARNAAIYGEQTQLTVSGQLDEQETDDISKAMKIIDAMLNDFMSGNIDQAVSRNNGFQQLSTLSLVDADMEKQTTVTADSNDDDLFIDLSERLLAEKEEQNEDSPLEEYLDTILDQLLSTGLPETELINLVNTGIKHFTQQHPDTPSVTTPAHIAATILTDNLKDIQQEENNRAYLS